MKGEFSVCGFRYLLFGGGGGGLWIHGFRVYRALGLGLRVQDSVLRGFYG